MKAARWLGIDPRELPHEPLVWTLWALGAMEAEAEAQKKIEEAEKKKAKLRKGGG